MVQALRIAKHNKLSEQVSLPFDFTQGKLQAQCKLT